MEPPRDSDADEASRFAISGHRMDVSDRLREHTLEGLRDVSAKYFGGAEDASVTLTPNGSGGVDCSLRFHAGRGLFFEGHGAHADAAIAFNQALERVAKQLRRRKRALREDKPTNPTRQGVL